MSEQEIFESVQEIFRTVFDDDSIVLTREMTADDIEDWDSLEQINLLVAIEKKFSVKFKLDDVKNLPNVGAMLDLVKRMVA
ncbi:acyl carrier protein [Anaerofilum sp. BX8]|uniref:Acyl carrier protein n=1 Tax=Anaerofilum hominis TaxID=2763016 RepID=A0A923I861_9FIRM|nr:acyl carrier protein [Anaerofilum hominis]MBC5582055.1 acyl carrier protein [Anaerofilum hominis]